MPDHFRRRVTLLDGIIVVASVALGLGLLRLRLTFADVPRFFTSIFDSAPWRWSPRLISVRLSGLLELAIPCVLMWTLGLLVLRLLPPRPGLRRLARQPGFVACVTFLAVAILCYATVLATLGIRGELRSPTPRDLISFHSSATLLMAHLGGWAVAVAWFILRLSGRWRSELSWIDRLGRLLGVFWIGTALVLTDLFNSIILRS